MTCTECIVPLQNDCFKFSCLYYAHTYALKKCIRKIHHLFIRNIFMNYLTVIRYIYSTYHTSGNFKHIIILNLWEFVYNQMIILDVDI